MYDEFVKRLRTMADWVGIRFLDDSENVRTNLSEAADAIENTSRAYQMMAEAYEAEVTKHCWIPVTEQLPEDWHDVLVYAGELFPYITVGYYDGLWKFSFNYKEIAGGIDYWMPLSESPKEETK